MPPVKRPKAAAPTATQILDVAERLAQTRGFNGFSYADIASELGVTKASLHYHFASKADLYAEILRDMFGAVEARVRQAAASTASPEDKVRQFAVAIAAEAELRPHFPPIWFREIAEGGAHLDPRTLQHLAGVVGTLRRIIDEGVRAGRFRRVHPFLVHAGIVGPLLLFFASQRLRGRLEKAGVPTGTLTRDQVLQHVQELALATLEGRKS